VELVYTRALEARARKGLRVRASPCAPEQTLSGIGYSAKIDFEKTFIFFCVSDIYIFRSYKISSLHRIYHATKTNIVIF